MKAILTICAVLLVSAPSWAERAPVQVGDHRGLGRVVISLGSTGAAIVRQRGTRIDVTVPADEDVVPSDTVPRNVLSIVGGHGTARLTVLSGAKVKSKQEGRTLVIDVLDPASRGRDAALTSGSRPNPGKPPAPPEHQEAATVPPSALEPAAPVLAETPHQVAEPAPAEAPAPANAPPQTPPPVVRSFTVNATAETGAAAFRRGGLGVVVFDEIVALADGEGGDAALKPAVQLVGRGTLMTLPLTDDDTLVLTRSDDSLTVTVGCIAPGVRVGKGRLTRRPSPNKRQPG